MKNQVGIEAEGGELLIMKPGKEGSKRAIAIIPKNKAEKVKSLLASSSDRSEEINDIVNKLPIAKDYAEGGSRYTIPDEDEEEKVTQIPKGDPIPEGMIDLDEQKKKIAKAAKGNANKAGVAIGVGDLSKLTEKEKALASSTAVLAQEKEKNRLANEIKLEDEAKIFANAMLRPPLEIKDLIEKGSTYEENSSQKRSDLHKRLNEEKGLYRSTELISSTGKLDYGMQAKVARYEKATVNGKPLYNKHYNINKADGTPYYDTIDETTWEKEMPVWRDAGRKPIYMNIEENSSLHNMPAPHVSGAQENRYAKGGDLTANNDPSGPNEWTEEDLTVDNNSTNARVWNPNDAEGDLEFQDWFKKNTLEGQNNISYTDAPDYDYYSFYKDKATGDIENHFPDTYKRSSHPTFSTDSMYSTPELQGGTWEGDNFIKSDRQNAYDRLMKKSEGAGAHEFYKYRALEARDNPNKKIEKPKESLQGVRRVNYDEYTNKDTPTNKMSEPEPLDMDKTEEVEKPKGALQGVRRMNYDEYLRINDPEAYEKTMKEREANPVEEKPEIDYNAMFKKDKARLIKEAEAKKNSK